MQKKKLAFVIAILTLVPAIARLLGQHRPKGDNVSPLAA